MRNRQPQNIQQNLFGFLDADSYFQSQINALHVSSSLVKKEAYNYLPPIDNSRQQYRAKENMYNSHSQYVKQDAAGSSLYDYKPRPLGKASQLVDSLDNFAEPRGSSHNGFRANNILALGKSSQNNFRQGYNYESVIDNAVGADTSRTRKTSDFFNNSAPSKNFVIRSRIADNILGGADNTLKVPSFNSVSTSIERNSLSNNIGRDSLFNNLGHPSRKQTDVDLYMTALTSKNSLHSKSEASLMPAGKKSIAPGVKTSNFKITVQGQSLRAEFDIDALYSNLAQNMHSGAKDVYKSLEGIMSAQSYGKFCKENANNKETLDAVKDSIRRRLQHKMKIGRKQQLESVITQVNRY